MYIVRTKEWTSRIKNFLFWYFKILNSACLSGVGEELRHNLLPKICIQRRSLIKQHLIKLGRKEIHGLGYGHGFKNLWKINSLDCGFSFFAISVSGLYTLSNYDNVYSMKSIFILFDTRLHPFFTFTSCLRPVCLWTLVFKAFLKKGTHGELLDNLSYIFCDHVPLCSNGDNLEGG